MAPYMDFYLLDLLREKSGCEYVSDLHFLDEMQKARLAYHLEKVDAEDYLLREWNDALAYIVKAPAQETVEKAKETLLKELRRTA